MATQAHTPSEVALVTESGVMSEPERILTCLERPREIGVRLAIDDFGTGSSSLAYLHRLPIHACKIARSSAGI